MSLLFIIGATAIVLIILAIFFVKRLIWLAINTLVGIFALMGWNVLFPSFLLPINWFSVLLVALTGIFGLLGLVGWQLIF